MKKNIDIENKDVFLKIEPSDSVDIKRALLEIEAASINMQLIAERFREKTDQEMKERAMAKKNLKDASNMIYSLIESLPKTKEPVVVKHAEARKNNHEKAVEMPKKEKNYAKQLEDIRKKIASL